jgi:hypothetical protein
MSVRAEATRASTDSSGSKSSTWASQLATMPGRDSAIRLATSRTVVASATAVPSARRLESVSLRSRASSRAAAVSRAAAAWLA